MARLTSRKRILILASMAIVYFVVFILAWTRLTETQFIIFLFAGIAIAVIVEFIAKKREKQSR